MYQDNDLIMSAAQAVTSSAASTNIIDQTKAGDAIGEQLMLVIRSIAAATAAGAATVNFVLQTSTDSAFTTPITLWDSGSIAKTALTANTIQAKVAIPLGAKQYLRVYYTVGTGPLTAGTFDAFLTKFSDHRY